jgi:predicted Rossmann-fold nucleotide-binding protein
VAPPRRIMIIAVFGPTSNVPPDMSAVARRLGKVIASRGHIVLTGGQAAGDGAGCTAVKECAVVGAEEAAPDAATLSWIAVENSRDPAVPERSRSRHGLVLFPGYRHGRNYVEADLCDAAIALPGGPGTGSEVAFCLALGCPVVLLGSAWRERYNVSSLFASFEALANFRADVDERVRSSYLAYAPPPWRGSIEDAYEKLWRGDLSLPRVEYRPLPDDGEEDVVVDLALEMLGVEPADE